MRFNTCLIMGELALLVPISLFLILRYRRHGLAGFRHIGAGLAIIGLMTLLGMVFGSLFYAQIPRLLSGERRVWQQQTTPPVPVSEILGSETLTQYPFFPAEGDAILFRTEDGVYACGSAQCRKVAQMPDSSQLCSPVGSPLLQDFSEVVDSLEVVCYIGPFEVFRDFVLLKNGQVFAASWRILTLEDGLESAFVAGVVGFTAGVIVVVAIFMRVKRRNVTAETSVHEIGGNSDE